MAEKIKAFILDDEAKSISNLKNLISQYCPQIGVLGSSQSPIEAVKFIHEHSVEVLFLDIEMPLINGFDFLKLFEDSIDFKVIFVTAYNQFAIEAIKVNALDYLLKPISIKELINTEQKLLKVLRGNEAKHIENQQLVHLLTDMAKRKSIQKLMLPTEEGLIIKPLQDILYFKSENNYTYVHNTDGSSQLISKTLKGFESLLESSGFVRIHNSYLVNILYIEKVVKHDGGYVIMKGGDKLMVSRRKMTVLQEQLKSNFKTLK